MRFPFPSLSPLGSLAGESDVVAPVAGLGGQRAWMSGDLLRLMGDVSLQPAFGDVVGASGNC